MTRHTILLVELPGNQRTYDQFPSIRAAMNAVCQLFERKLKQMHPDKTQITYDINDLNNYIDHLPDLAAMTLNERDGIYIPHNKEWIKKEILNHLTKQANDA